MAGLFIKYKKLNLKFPLSKEMAIYYLKMGYKIVLRDNKSKGCYVCCEYNGGRMDYMRALFPKQFEKMLYKFPILIRRDIRTLLKQDLIAFKDNPIGIFEDDICGQI